MIRLEVIDEEYLAHVDFLYQLLKERKPYQAISHKEMPTFEQHWEFIKSKPYKAWYIIATESYEFVGATYLTHQNEIGIFILERFCGLGYGQEGVQMLMARFPGPFLANINPSNMRSQEFFKALGFTELQVTYSHE